MTGVRFFFTLAGGYYGAPFDASGNVQQQWSNNLYNFFRDLRSYGIEQVTPTPVFAAWSGTGMITRTVLTCTDANGNGGFIKTLNFLPWLPYGFDPDDSGFPERECGNQSYFQAAQTPSDIFWGWEQIFNMMNSVLAQAHAAGIGIGALDYYQETNIADFTVDARMIYDTYRNVDVLGEFRNRMSANGFDPGRVAPSANSGPSPSPASADCPSFYGESAMLMTLSELTAAIAGPWSVVGVPPSTISNGLRCVNGYDYSQMISLPVYHTQPTFIDMHSQKVYGSTSETATWAKNFYTDIWAFLQYRGMTGSLVVFGETNPVDNPGCDEWTRDQADAVINGIPGANNGYKHSTLYQNNAANVIFRPWHDGTYVNNTCTPSPNIINPPFNPFNP